MSNAPLLWAQRSSEDEESKNVLLITIEAPELDDSYTLEFPEEGSKLVFKGKSKAYPSAGHTEQPKEYAIDLELFDKVNTDSVKKSLTGKSLNIVVQKKELKIEYWPRLTKDKKKLQFIKTDFSKWVDEDEQDAAEELDSGMDQGMGGNPYGAGMGGMGGGMGGGAGGMPDMASLMAQMGGGGGMGGAGGMPDMAELMKSMGGGGAGGMPDFGDGDEDGEDGDDDDLPELETPAAGKGKGKAAAADSDDMPPLEEA